MVSKATTDLGLGVGMVKVDQCIRIPRRTLQSFQPTLLPARLPPNLPFLGEGTFPFLTGPVPPTHGEAMEVTTIPVFLTWKPLVVDDGDVYA